MKGINASLRTARALLIAALALTSGTLGAATNSATAPFGFTGPEIFPLSALVQHLRVADIDGDGRQDIIVVNNARSRINILVNQTGSTNRAKPLLSGKTQINELPPDSRFRIDSVSSEKRITTLVVADLNGDKRPDLAYYGEPKELVVQYNQPGGGWSAPKRWAIDDGLTDPNALIDADLDGDGRRDLLLLAEGHLYRLLQKADGTFAEPEKLPYSDTVKSVAAVDLNADKREDMLLVNWESPNPLRFRLQGPAGQFGPEIPFTLPAIRSFTADDLDGNGTAEIVLIAMKSGRAQVGNFTRKPAEPLAGALQAGQLQVLPLLKTGKARRGTAWADVNGDKLADLLVAEPDSGQLTLLLQEKDGSLGAPRTFPALTGVSDIVVGDWDGDGRSEIFLLSQDERQVGVTRYDESGRIAFPTVLPVEGRPIAMALRAARTGSLPSLALILDQDGKRELQLRSATGQPSSQKLNESFKANPSTMAFHDVNHDGREDLVVLIPFEKIKVLLAAGDDKPFEEHDVAPPGGSAEQPWMGFADVDGDGKPELLLAQKNFLRAVVLQTGAPAAGGKAVVSFLVREQINGTSPNSQIVAAAPVPGGTNATPFLFLLDAERKALTLCERDAAGVWQARRNLPLPVSDFSDIVPVGLGAATPNAVALMNTRAVAWMRFGGDVWELTELDGYETPVKDGYLNDVVPGDLNGDARKDLVFLETAKNHIDLVSYGAPHQLVPADRWQVFEERTFRNRRSEMPEPREAAVADVNGDGRNDLILLVHDRALVYLQE